jgi:hypothetical protein
MTDLLQHHRTSSEVTFTQHLAALEQQLPAASIRLQ